MIQAFVRNMRTCWDDGKGACQAGNTRETLSTEALHTADLPVVVMKDL